MRATEFITEAPLTDYVPVDFDQKGQFKPVDKRLITHPTTISKAEKVFARIPHDVRLFFVNKRINVVGLVHLDRRPYTAYLA